MYEKTPAEIAAATLDAHAIKPNWNRTGAHIAELIAEAVEADRAQRFGQVFPQVFPTENGPDVQFWGPRIEHAQRVAAAHSAWSGAGEGDDSEELYSRFVDALELYAGIDYK